MSISSHPKTEMVWTRSQRCKHHMVVIMVSILFQNKMEQNRGPVHPR